MGGSLFRFSHFYIYIYIDIYFFYRLLTNNSENGAVLATDDYFMREGQ